MTLVSMLLIDVFVIRTFAGLLKMPYRFSPQLIFKLIRYRSYQFIIDIVDQ